MKKISFHLLCLVLLNPCISQASLLGDTGTSIIQSYPVSTKNLIQASVDNPCSIQVNPGDRIQAAVDSAASGDVICIAAGNYSESVLIQQKNHLIVKAVPNDRQSVVIDGSGVTLSLNGRDPYFSGLITIENSQQILIEGFKLQNSSGFGIIAYQSEQIVIQNNHTQNTRNSGISAWGNRHVVPTSESQYIIIHNNEVEFANNGGQQENISLQDVNQFIVGANYVHSTGNGSNGIGGEGIDAKNGAKNGYIYHNTVTRSLTNGKPCLYIDGYQQGKHTYNIELFGNFVTDCGGPGIMIASEEGGEVENILIHDNVIYHNKNNQYGIKISSYDDGGDPERHIIHNLSIFNNSLIENDGGIMISEKDPASPGNPVNFENIVIANNLLESNHYFPQMQFESILENPTTFKPPYLGQFIAENNLFFPNNSGASLGAYIRYDGNHSIQPGISMISAVNPMIMPATSADSQRIPYQSLGLNNLDSGEDLSQVLDHFNQYQLSHDDNPLHGSDAVDFPVPESEFTPFMVHVHNHLQKDFSGNPRISGAGVDIGAVELQVGPSADFSANPINLLTGTEVTFSGTSNDAIIDWSWDFNTDGIEDANGQTVQYTFQSSGTYSVAMTASTQSESTRMVKNALLHVYDPYANFNADKVSGIAPLTVNFSDTSWVNNPHPNYWWDFDDGQNSSVPSPTHTFEQSGQFLVQLTIDGESQLSKTLQVSVIDPVADFGMSSDSVMVEDTIVFEDLSSVKNITQWNWDFGDGSTSTAPSPSHRYALAGHYTVALTVIGEAGISKSVSKMLQVNSAPQEIADMAMTRFVSEQPSYSLGRAVGYQFIIENQGPNTAKNVVVTLPLPDNTAWVFGPSQCLPSPTQVICQFGDLTHGSSRNRYLYLRPSTSGTLTIQAEVSSDNPDDVPSNNQRSTDVSIE